MTEAGVKSAVRALEILEAFERYRRPLSLKEITIKLGYPVSSASVLLKSLLVMGYLDYDNESRTYMPTMRLSLIGRWAEEMLVEKVELISAMQALHRETGEVVILGTQSDIYAQYLHYVYSDEPLEVRAMPGLCRSLAHSGMGWAILAQKCDSEVEHLRRRINIQMPCKLSQETLSSRVWQVRAKGYAFSRHTVAEGAGSIAMAIPKASFGRVLALGVGGDVSKLEGKENMIASSLRATVAALSDLPARRALPAPAVTRQ